MTSILIYAIGWQRYWWLASRYDRLRSWLEPLRMARCNRLAREELEHKLTGILARYGCGSLDIDRDFEELCDDIDVHIEQQCVDAIAQHYKAHPLLGTVQ